MLVTPGGKIFQEDKSWTIPRGTRAANSGGLSSRTVSRGFERPTNGHNQDCYETKIIGNCYLNPSIAEVLGSNEKPFFGNAVKSIKRLPRIHHKHTTIGPSRDQETIYQFSLKMTEGKIRKEVCHFFFPRDSRTHMGRG